MSPAGVTTPLYLWSPALTGFARLPCSAWSRAQAGRTGGNNNGNRQASGGKPVAAFASNVTSKTYLSGLSALMEAMMLPDAYAEGYIQRLVGSLVPTGVAQVRRAEDPYLRYASGLTDALAARIPGLSEGLPLRRDVWGRPISQESGLGPAYDLVSPIYSRKPAVEPIDTELQGLGWFPTTPPKRVDFEGVTVNLANRGEIWGRYVELAGNELKHPAWNLGLKDLLNAEGRHPLGDYYRLLSDGPEGGKRDFIREQLQDYRSRARGQLLREFPDLAAEVDRRRGERPGKFALH